VTTSPSVSVLTAVRNGASFLEETVASIQQQSYADWEYIIVDDASEDGSAAIVEGLARRDPRIRLIRRRASGGPYVAANEGLRSARGKYIVRTDGDDLSPPNRIQRQLEFLESRPTHRACVSFFRFFGGGRVRPGISTVPVSPGAFRWYLLLRGASTHSSLCVERAALVELGGYRELPLAQDYRLLCELSQRGWLGVVPEVLSLVRSHEQRASVTRGALQRTLAVGIVTDHMKALSGEVWTPEEIQALYAVGHAMPLPVRVGLGILDRWDRLWQAAPNLTAEDRRTLVRLSAFRRRKHLWANGRRQPLATGHSLVKLVLTRPSSLFGSAMAVHA
jgi:glycosyltransferase involved in cell wall biosynthesis